MYKEGSKREFCDFFVNNLLNLCRTYAAFPCKSTYKTTWSHYFLLIVACITVKVHDEWQKIETELENTLYSICNSGSNSESVFAALTRSDAKLFQTLPTIFWDLSSYVLPSKSALNTGFKVLLACLFRPSWFTVHRYLCQRARLDLQWIWQDTTQKRTVLALVH